MLSLRQVKDFAFFQGWGLPISFAYPSSVKPAWQHLLDKSKALKTAMFYRGLFYLSYSKPAGEYQLLREEEGMSLALFHYQQSTWTQLKSEARRYNTVLKRNLFHIHRHCWYLPDQRLHHWRSKIDNYLSPWIFSINFSSLLTYKPGLYVPLIPPYQVGT